MFVLFLDDLGASKLQMGWTVTIGNTQWFIIKNISKSLKNISKSIKKTLSNYILGMITSLPFLIFSGPITEVW